MIKFFVICVSGLALAACAQVPAGAAGQMSSAGPGAARSPREVIVAQALSEISRFSADVLMTDGGVGLSDYDLVGNEWLIYETHWHTGQLIWGLLEAGQALERPDLISRAELGGRWWVSTMYPEGHPLAGLVAAAHGDRLGDLINWTTIADGTPGLFALSRVTGDNVYADAAAASGEWLWANTRVPDSIEGGEWLFYNIVDPDLGIVYTDWDVHTQGVLRDPERVGDMTPAITRLARPNIEGFLFGDMCRHTGDQIWCDRFLAQADSVLARQGSEGLWLDFEPNETDGSQVHPRFNIWNAEALLQAYAISGDRKYLEGAARTARWAQGIMREDGTLYYRTTVDGRTNRAEVTGSAVAFNGVLMLRLKAYGYDEFSATIETFVDWIVANRFSAGHPDPNLAGSVIDTRQKQQNGRLVLINRDVGSTFAMRFLSLYLRDLRGEDVNAHLNKELGR